MLPGQPRSLQFPLNLSATLENETPNEPVGGRPVFPAEPDEKIIVPVEISANEFTYLASTVDVGRDLAYPDQSQYIWWLWNRIFLAMNLCEAVAQCLIDQNEALINALADALANNATLRAAIAESVTEEGGAIPGRPVSDQQAEQDTLPNNVRDEEGECIPDNLWGGCLYLVQSGNRAITDFFDILEAASNTLEASAIIAQNIPAVGQYAASAASFADQMRENIAEGYAAAYTEAYEQSLACDLFCLARVDCTLSLDAMISVLNARLTSPIDIGDMGEIMAGIASGTWVGDEIADVAFMVYFSAVRFGQQFTDQIGVRPLTDLMSLGADQLSSDNWTVLCDCPTDWEYTANLATLASWDDYAFADAGIYNALTGWEANPASTHNGVGIFGIATTGTFLCTSVTVKITSAMTGDQNGVVVGSLDLSVATQEIMGTVLEFECPVSLTLNGIAVGYTPNDVGSGNPDFPGATYEVIVRGFGYQPPELGG